MTSAPATSSVALSGARLDSAISAVLAKIGAASAHNPATGFQVDCQAAVDLREHLGELRKEKSKLALQ